MGLAACFTTTGCAGKLSVLAPAGPAAEAIATLWWVMFWGGVAIFIITSIVLALSLRRSAREVLTPWRLIVLGGLVVPSAVLTALVIAAFALGERLIASPGEAEPLRIEAMARQWRWEFRYPEADGVVTIDKLYIPAGRDIDFVVTSSDVIHSFWIPRLGGKIDAIPGHRNVVRLRADRPGVYGGVCAEFCGDGHTVMRFSVEAHAAEAYPATLSGIMEAESDR